MKDLAHIHFANAKTIVLVQDAVLDAIEYVGEERAGEYLAAMKNANPKVDLEKLKAYLPRGVSAYLVALSPTVPRTMRRYWAC